MLAVALVVVAVAVVLAFLSGAMSVYSAPCAQASINHPISRVIVRVIAFGIPVPLLVGGLVLGRTRVEPYVGYWIVLIVLFMLPYALVDANCRLRHELVHPSEKERAGGRIGGPWHSDDAKRRASDRLWLERTLSGLAGVKIVVLAGLTLLPSLLSWKVLGGFDLPVVGVVYVVYHGIGAYLWFHVHHVRALDGSPLAMSATERAEIFDRLVPLARFWEKLGTLVLVLVFVSLILAGAVAGHRLDAPDFVCSLLGIRP